MTMVKQKDERNIFILFVLELVTILKCIRKQKMHFLRFATELNKREMEFILWSKKSQSGVRIDHQIV